MADMSQWDPSVIADRAYLHWCRLDVRLTAAIAEDDENEWRALGVDLFELKNRLEWLGLYRTPGGAS